MISESLVQELLKQIADLRSRMERISKKESSAKNNYSATVAPTISDDANLGYGRSSLWINTSTNNIYMCANPAAGAAVWRLLN